MTKKEAFLFFPFEEDDDLDDLYEERLFEFKQFFITKFPLEKVFFAKEKKMLQMHLAFIYLSESTEKSPIQRELPTISFSTNIKESFQLYQQHRSTLKNNILQSSNSNEVSFQIHQLLELQKKYNEIWTMVSILPESEIPLSVEPDPMAFLNVIHEFNQLGGYTFEDLNTMRNISPELLLNEAKRLSLCFKM